jgi:aspartate kinase
MALIVHKYGGTSLATSARIRDVAARVGIEKRAGHDVIVVVSAMADTTDHLLALATDITPHPDPRELDMLLTTGERISMALVAMALNSSGLNSISLTGSQSGIITDGTHTRARILDVKGDRIQEGLAAGRIVIVAGFQGVSLTKEVTTLGRGGSDVTAVALAARFGAVRCDIFTDVDGVYTADPGRVPTARRVAAIDHESMVVFAELGAGVLHPRAARWALRERVPVVVRSSFIPGPGTLVGADPKPAPAPVLGLGCRRGIRVFEAATPPPPANPAQDEEQPVLLVAPTPAGRVRIARASDASDPVTPGMAAGDLLSVIVRPDQDPVALADHLVPASARVLETPLVTARAISFLVRPEIADDLVRLLHHELIETATPLAVVN